MENYGSWESSAEVSYGRLFFYFGISFVSLCSKSIVTYVKLSLGK